MIAFTVSAWPIRPAVTLDSIASEISFGSEPSFLIAVTNSASIADTMLESAKGLTFERVVAAGPYPRDERF